MAGWKLTDLTMTEFDRALSAINVSFCVVKSFMRSNLTYGLNGQHHKTFFLFLQCWPFIVYSMILFFTAKHIRKFALRNSSSDISVH